MTPDQIAGWQAELVQADRRWATAHRVPPLPADRMATLCRVLAGASRDINADTVNTRTMLRRLVTAITAEWSDDRSEVRQAQEALKQLRRVEAYLLSLNEEKKGAA